MQVSNIYNKKFFQDSRGQIVDILDHEEIHHVAIITSEPNVIRGNHYHKETTQWILILEGSLIYYWRENLEDTTTKQYQAFIGDLICTPANEIHTLGFPMRNRFMVFAKGKRGGNDYESDTFRVESIIP